MKPPRDDGEIKMDQMTRDDLKKIQKSMKKPQFLGLLNEYMVQISDPKNKNEYDEYLRQLQSEKELPKHMKIVQLKPRFCFRTFIVSQKNKTHEMKFFVNMCESEYLEKPSCEPTPDHEGKVGYSWKIPNSMGKIRYDQDKKGSPCQVVDIAFHPDTFMFGVRKEFKEMMVNIALEAAERQLGERKETLSRDYIILKNVICKGQDGKPALMPIRYIEGKIYNKGDGPNNEFERDMEGKETKLQKQINKQKEEHNNQKQKQKSAAKEGEEEEKEEELEEKAKLVQELNKGVEQPKHKTIYTYPIDYSEFIDSPYTSKKKVPSAFNIEFAIPRVESMQEIADQQLEINDKKIILKIGQKYFIDLQFDELRIKYVLLTGNAKAKYDKKKKCLRIVIPIDQSVNYEPEKEVKEDSSKPEEPKEEVVEDQTWKNKVLDFTEPSVSVRMLEQTQKQEEAPKLVEEIDEEDIVEQPKEDIKKEGPPQQDDEINEQVYKPAEKKFTIRNYYSKANKEEKDGESKRIGFLFQETADKVVLVLQMKNYRKEDIKFINADDRQFLIVWDQNQKEERDSSLVRYEHLKLAENILEKVQKIDFVFRVGFLAVMVVKKGEGKGNYWQKEAVEQVPYPGQNQEEQLNAFYDFFSLQQQAEKQREKLKEEKVKEEKEVLNKMQEEKGEKVQPSEQIVDNHEELTENKPAEPKMMPKPVQERSQCSSMAIQQSLLKNLQPQYIVFQAEFAFMLD